VAYLKELKGIIERHKENRSTFAINCQQEYPKPRQEVLFTERESAILKSLEANKRDVRRITQIKEVFPRSRIRFAYKININNSKNPIEKISPGLNDDNIRRRKPRQRVLL